MTVPVTRARFSPALFAFDIYSRQQMSMPMTIPRLPPTCPREESVGAAGPLLSV
jgi:hypothetical protein